MSRQIPMDKPLSEEDRAYLLMRGEDGKVAWFDQNHPAVTDAEEEETDEEDQEVEDGYDEMTVPALQARIAELNAEGAEITPASNKKADLITALRDYDALPDEDE